MLINPRNRILFIPSNKLDPDPTPKTRIQTLPPKKPEPDSNPNKPGTGSDTQN